jgi:3-mercaptopyruvate sulfurtransferase SseA
VRDGLDSMTYMIPGARAISLGALRALDVPRDDIVVLYSDGGAHAAQGWILLQLQGYRRARVLKDGMAAWEDEVLSPLVMPVTDDASREREARVRALSLWFGGRPRLGDAPFTQATNDPTLRRRRRTC